jgi:hypothetical protein
MDTEHSRSLSVDNGSGKGILIFWVCQTKFSQDGFCCSDQGIERKSDDNIVITGALQWSRGRFIRLALGD